MSNYSQQLEDAWLGIDVDESKLFNPMDFVMPVSYTHLTLPTTSRV